MPRNEDTILSPIEITIPLAPVTKKNSQQILTNRATGRPFVAPSSKYKTYERQCLWHLRVHKQKPPIDTPVNVKCTFYLPTRRKTDLTNLLEAVDDILVKAEVLADDNYTIVTAHDGSRCRYDKENPRTEILITELKDE